MRSLLQAGLLTDLELFVAPIGLGGGTPLLAPKGPYTLLFRNADCYSAGAVRLLYTIVYP
jgi:hypothetical protein